MISIKDELDFLNAADIVLEYLESRGGVANFNSFFDGDLPDKDDVFTFLEEKNCLKTHDNRLRITSTGRMWIRKGGFAIQLKRERRNRNFIFATFIVACLSLVVGIVSLCM